MHIANKMESKVSRSPSFETVKWSREAFELRRVVEHGLQRSILGEDQVNELEVFLGNGDLIGEEVLFERLQNSNVGTGAGIFGTDGSAKMIAGPVRFFEDIINDILGNDLGRTFEGKKVEAYVIGNLSKHWRRAARGGYLMWLYSHTLLQRCLAHRCGPCRSTSFIQRINYNGAVLDLLFELTDTVLERTACHLLRNDYSMGLIFDVLLVGGTIGGILRFLRSRQLCTQLF